MEKQFGQGWQNWILRFKRNILIFYIYFLFFQFFSGIDQNFFAVLAKNLQHVSRNCIIRVRENILRKLIIVQFCPTFFTYGRLQKLFSYFWQKILDRVVKTAFSNSRGTLWGKIIVFETLFSCFQTLNKIQTRSQVALRNFPSRRHGNDRLNIQHLILEKNSFLREKSCWWRSWWKNSSQCKE